jgi:TRAP transporter TAXI family solute receptor
MTVLKSFFSNLLFSFGLIIFLTSNSHAQSVEELRASINKGTVGIVGGSVGGTYSRFAQDLSNVIDEVGDVRVLATLGKGSQQNIYDLLFLRGIDLAIVQSDVLEALSENPPIPDLKDKIRYITKLYNEEIHIVARKEIISVKQLVGKRVSVGNTGSGTNMTARVVFKALDIPIEYVNQPVSEAKSSLLNGDIDAIVYVAGKPVATFESFTKSDNVGLIKVEMEKELSDAGYISGNFTAQDYPALVDTPVPTIAVGAILAVYNWPEDDDETGRYRKTERMTNEILNALPLLREDRFHKKWKDVNPKFELESWNRFKPAVDWARGN